MTVSDREGANGLAYVSGNDPRLVTIAVGSTPVYAPSNQSTAASPMVLASGIEGALIEAEAALAAGQLATWSDILTTLRQSAISPSMPALTADSTTGAAPAQRLAVMFRERAFWLFGTGHRHGDLRRLVRQYGLPVENVFPSGLYQGGPSTFGSAVVFQPAGETNDPNYHGCTNTGA
jgi:hypothetical protein